MGWHPGPVVGAFFALSAILLSACAQPSVTDSPPRVNLVDLRPLEMTLFEQRYRVKLRIQNPNDAPLEVRGMDYAIDINKEKFAEGVSDEQFSVPPYGERVVEVTLTSSLMRLIAQFRRLEQRGNLVLDYRLAGRLRVAGLPGSYAFSHEDTLDLSAEPRAGGTAL